MSNLRSHMEAQRHSNVILSEQIDHHNLNENFQ